MRTEILKIFDEFIAETFKTKPDLMKFFLKHERKKLCVDNLCKEIEEIERRNYKITFEASEYRKLIRSMSKFFCETALAHHQQTALSSLERLRLERELNKDKENEELIKEMVKDGMLVDTDKSDYKLGADDAPSDQDEPGA